MLGLRYVNFYFTTLGTLDLYLISYDLQVESETIWLKNWHAFCYSTVQRQPTNQPTRAEFKQQSLNVHGDELMGQSFCQNCSQFLQTIYTSMMRHTSYPAYNPITVAKPQRDEHSPDSIGSIQNRSSKFRDDEVGGSCKAKLFWALSETIL
jgi:hypothetical protein